MEILVTLSPRDNGEEATIVLNMTDAVYAELHEIADKRGLPLEEVIGEALRLESLFADATVSNDKSLLLRRGHDIRELTSV